MFRRVSTQSALLFGSSWYESNFEPGASQRETSDNLYLDRRLTLLPPEVAEASADVSSCLPIPELSLLPAPLFRPSPASRAVPARGSHAGKAGGTRVTVISDTTAYRAGKHVQSTWFPYRLHGVIRGRNIKLLVELYAHNRGVYVDP